MVVEFKAIEAIDSLVALLRVAEDSAVHCWEQDEAFHPGIFPGLILLARFASQRAGEEFRQAIAAAEQIRKLNESCDELRHSATDRDTFRDGLHELKKEFDQLREQLAQVTAERDSLKDELETVENLHDAACQQVAELSGNPGELPAEPAPETYQWKVGDLVIMGHAALSSGNPRKVIAVHPMGVFLEGYESGHAQAEWERNGWKLFRKAGDLGVQQLTPRQVEISDSTGTDGEGQS